MASPAKINREPEARMEHGRRQSGEPRGIFSANWKVWHPVVLKVDPDEGEAYLARLQNVEAEGGA